MSKKRLIQTSLRAASDRDGAKTFRAINQMVGKPQTYSALEAANSVGKRMTPKK